MNAPGDDAAPPAELEPDPSLVERIAARARGIARERLRRALGGQASPAAPRRHRELDGELLDRIADEEADRADGPLLRVSLAEAAAEELGLEPTEGLAHPATIRARELLREAARAEARSRPAAQRPAVLVEAVHVFGIETVPPGDADIELRFADTGIDVRRPSTGTTIGRLRWGEVQTVAMQRPRRDAGGLQRSAQLVVAADRGEVTFELVGLSNTDITAHLEPLIARNCEGFRGAVAG